jgi:hypothetical protein
MGEGLKRAVAAAKRTWVCHWVRDDVDDSYDTDCGKKFQLSTTDTLHEHGMIYCCFCGHQIKEQR